MKEVFALVAVLAGCGTDPPTPQYPPMQTEVRNVESRNTAATAPVVSADVAPEKPDQETPDPAFADGPVQSLGKEEIRILAKALPLSTDAIRFEAIDNFLLLYAPYTSNKALLRETRKAFRAAQACLQVPLRAFSLSSGSAEVAAALKQPYPGRYYFPFLQALMSGVSRTKDVILDFREQVGGKLSAEDEERVGGQIGMYEHDDSIARRNLSALTQMYNAVHISQKSGE